MKNNRANRHNDRGFTLSEVLLTVAILVVLFALAAVPVSKMRRELRQTELDSQLEAATQLIAKYNETTDGLNDLAAQEKAAADELDAQIQARREEENRNNGGDNSGGSGGGGSSGSDSPGDIVFTTRNLTA